MEKKDKKKSPLWIAGVIAIAFLIVIAAFTFIRPSPTEKTGSYDLTMVDLGFDTPVTFEAECDEQTFVTYLDILRNRFITNNQLFDQYEEYEGITNIRSINLAPANTWIEVDPLITDCLKLAKEANTLFDKFDVTQGKVISLWHDFREGESSLPGSEEILETINSMGMEAIEFEDGKIMKTSEDVWLDLGAIAKGYTVQQCVEELEAAGCDSGYINAGGNVALIGSKKSGDPWKVGIIEPDSDQSIVRYTTESPTCLVTSGDYQRFVVVDGKRYSHIIDPSTGYPAQFVRSVTVINDDSAWADALSTIMFLMDVEDGLQFCKENNISAVWICDQGESNLTPDDQKDGFDIYMTEDLKSSVSING